MTGVLQLIVSQDVLFHHTDTVTLYQELVLMFVLG